MKHALRGPGSRIATIVWEERRPNLRKSLGGLLSVGYVAQVVVLRDPSVARQGKGRIREGEGLRAPGGWIRHQIWEERRLTHVNAQVLDPFWVPSDAHPGKESQVVGGELKAQVVGGEAKAGRGHDRDLKRNRTQVKLLPTLWQRPALTPTVLAMVQSTLSDPSALPTATLKRRQPLQGL